LTELLEQLVLQALTVQPEPQVSLAYPARRALLASARQERWACLVPPGLQELQALTVQQEPPASLEFLAPLELLVSQVPLVLLESLAVMVLQAQQVSSVSLVRLA
jgi:hypothetical protein